MEDSDAMTFDRISSRFLLLIVMLAVPCCDSADGAQGPKGAAALARASSVKAGDVTVARLRAFDNAKVNRHAANFGQCVAAAEAQLGRVSKVDGDEYWWAATEGDACHAYLLVGDGEGMMARSKGPYEVGADELARCRELAG